MMLTQHSLIGVRDPYGIRPLVIGKLGNSYVLASETCALDIIGAKFVRDVENGEIVLIENDKLTSVKPFPPKKVRPCVFEYIYFARPDSILDNKTAYEHRKNIGIELAKENDIDADIVVPVPDSGNAAALGFAQYLKMNYEHGLIRNHYVGRTFIEPSQKIRSLGVKLKLNANKTTVKDKKIILIDDSLVRGTTSHKIVKMLYDAGAKEVHVRIACPEIKYPDFYGVDTPTKSGNLTNSISLRNKLVEDGAIFYTTSDTETIVQLIAKSKRPKTIDKVVDAIFQIQGGYALVMLTQHSLIGVRDPYGIRPLVIGKLGNSYVLASETCALDIIGAKFVRDVENGEIVLIENDKLTSVKPFPPKKVRPCVFEYIYFARPDSILDNKTAYEHRKDPKQLIKL